MSVATGVELIAAERARQVEEEGYTAEHDAHHHPNDLVYAATAYLMADHPGAVLDFWPWNRASFKPGERLRDLTKAGALIAAAVDAMQAAALDEFPDVAE